MIKFANRNYSLFEFFQNYSEIRF